MEIPCSSRNLVSLMAVWPPKGCHHVHRLFHLDDVHDVLREPGLKVQAVGGVVVRTLREKKRNAPGFPETSQRIQSCYGSFCIRQSSNADGSIIRTSGSNCALLNKPARSHFALLDAIPRLRFLQSVHACSSFPSVSVKSLPISVSASSEQAPYSSLRRKRQSSSVSLRLISPQRPFAGTPVNFIAQRVSKLNSFNIAQGFPLELLDRLETPSNQPCSSRSRSTTSYMVIH